MKRIGLFLAVAGVFLALGLFVTGALWSVHRKQIVDARLCATAVANRVAIRSTWNAARVLILAGISDPEVRRRTDEFFDGVLRPIPPLACVDNKPVPKEGP